MIHSAYFHSTTTLNYIRGLLTSGFASLNHPRDWSLSHVRSLVLRLVFLSNQHHVTLIHLKREEFEQITEGLADALDFSRTIGGGDGPLYECGGSKGVLGKVDFYTRSVTGYFPLHGKTKNCGEATKV
jgi:3-deoxy-7-phosphoheptulonate synthase